MKYAVIILLLSTTGLEEIKLKYDGKNCSEIAKAWVDVNMTYYPNIKGDPKLQGFYTDKNKLLLGWICN